MGNDWLLGSAEWGENNGLERNDALARLGVLLGQSADDRLFTLRAARHFITVSPTRSGKGVSLIIPNLLHYRGSAIVIDPKGENAWITAQYRREDLGQKTFILDPWGEVNRRYGELCGGGLPLETVARFNPLSILDPEDPNYPDDLAYLADAIILSQSKSDPFFDDSARELVAGIIAFAVETYGEEASLPMVRDFLSKPAQDIAILAEESQGLGENSVARRKLGRFTTDSRTNASIISTALSQTAFLDSMALGESLAHSDFSFSDLINGKATIYLVLPVDKLQTYGRWLRLMVSIGIRTVARNNEPLESPVLFLLDEFGTIGRLSAVAQAYGLMAGLQMCIWAFVQDLVQLKRDYPDDWETFISNSEAITFFNIMDQFSCEYFSKMLGKRTVERISQATAELRKGGFFKSPAPEASLMSDQLYSRDLLQPTEIRNLPQNVGIILSRSDPLPFRKIIYYADDDFFARARLDPHFPDLIPRWKKLKEERIVKKQKQRIEKIKAEREKAIPDFEAAKKMLEACGYSVKVEGMLSKTITATWGNNGASHTFKSKDALVHWTRENHPRPPVKTEPLEDPDDEAE